MRITLKQIAFGVMAWTLCVQAQAADILGFLVPQRDRVRIDVEQARLNMGVGQRLELVQQNESYWVVRLPQNGCPQLPSICTFKNKRGTAYITSDHYLVFAEPIKSSSGFFELHSGEELAVTDIEPKRYAVVIKRYGKLSQLYISKKQKHLKFVELKQAPITPKPQPVMSVSTTPEIADPVVPKPTLPDESTSLVHAEPAEEPLSEPPPSETAVTKKALFETALNWDPWAVIDYITPYVPPRFLDEWDLFRIAAFMALILVLRQWLRLIQKQRNEEMAPHRLAPKKLSPEPDPTRPDTSADTIGLATAILPDSGKDTTTRTRIGKYEVEQLLGRGSMGVVYRVKQPGLDRSVALKLLAQGMHADEGHKRRFIREARAIARLRHPGIVVIHEVGEIQNQPYFTMDFVKGQTLDQLLKKGPMAPARAVALVQQMAEAIGYAHGQHIIHRDLKPANIIVDENGQAVITDFGLARGEDSGLMSVSDDIVGTPVFMSPEQAMGKSSEVDPRSDIYSLGAVLYTLLSGKMPFKGESIMDILTQVIHEEPPPLSMGSEEHDIELEAIVQRAMAKKKENRYDSSRDFVNALVLWSGGEPLPKRKPRKWRLFGKS